MYYVKRFLWYWDNERWAHEQLEETKEGIRYINLLLRCASYYSNNQPTITCIKKNSKQIKDGKIL